MTNRLSLIFYTVPQSRTEWELTGTEITIQHGEDILNWTGAHRVTGHVIGYLSLRGAIKSTDVFEKD